MDQIIEYTIKTVGALVVMWVVACVRKRFKIDLAAKVADLHALLAEQAVRQTEEEHAASVKAGNPKETPTAKEAKAVLVLDELARAAGVPIGRSVYSEATSRIAVSLVRSACSKLFRVFT